MKRKPYRFLLYILLELANIIILILPYRTAVFLGGFFGGLAYTILPKYRNITLDNLRSAFAGEKSEKEIKRIARDVFRNLGKTAVECLSFRKLNQKDISQLVEDKGISVLKKALSQGKGAIAVGSHLGNWEASAAYTALAGLDVTVIARRIYYHYYNNFLVSIRNSKGVKTLYRDDKGVLRKSLESLNSNEILAIVPDQDVDSVNGVFVDFFGRKAYTPTGPVNLALLSGAPLIPAFIVRENGRLRFFAEEPIYVESSGDRKNDVIKYTQKWSNVVEKYIRMYPSQWVWMHKRWKTRPEAVKPA